MTEIRCVVLVVVLTFLQSLARGDVTEVSCVFMESCILPCSFQGGSDSVIHWIQETTGNTPVHSYYHNQDQLTHQDQRFRGRTSIFKDQISRGNASLQLTGVEVHDQSRYKCYISTISGKKESYINLKVDAPVCKVDIQQVENRITCSSEGIYPEPELTWSINPPSNVTLKNTTTVQQTEQQLYNINSSLIVSDNVNDLVYNCTVSTRRNWMTATFPNAAPANPPSVLPQEKGNSPSVGAIIGWVVAAILIVGAVAGLVICCKKKSSGQQGNSQSQPNNDETPQGTELEERADRNGPIPRENWENPANQPLLQEEEAAQQQQVEGEEDKQQQQQQVEGEEDEQQQVEEQE